PCGRSRPAIDPRRESPSRPVSRHSSSISPRSPGYGRSYREVMRPLWSCPRLRPQAHGLEVGHALELAEASLDLVERQPLQPLASELLDRIRRDHGSVDRRAAQDVLVVERVRVVVEVAEEPAREGVAGPGRIDDVVERVAGEEEEAAVAEDARAVAPLL